MNNNYEDKNFICISLLESTNKVQIGFPYIKQTEWNLHESPNLFIFLKGNPAEHQYVTISSGISRMQAWIICLASIVKVCSISC